MSCPIPLLCSYMTATASFVNTSIRSVAAPMRTVIYDVVLCREGAQVRADRDPLVQLRNSRDAATQFRLADQHNGQQKSVVEMKIRQ